MTISERLSSLAEREEVLSIFLTNDHFNEAANEFLGAPDVRWSVPVGKTEGDALMSITAAKRKVPIYQAFADAVLMRDVALGTGTPVLVALPA